MRNFYVKVAEKLLQKLHLNHDVFTNMAFLNPTLRQSACLRLLKLLLLDYLLTAGVHKNLEELSCEVGLYRVDPILP